MTKNNKPTNAEDSAKSSNPQFFVRSFAHMRTVKIKTDQTSNRAMAVLSQGP